MQAKQLSTLRNLLPLLLAATAACTDAGELAATSQPLLDPGTPWAIHTIADDLLGADGHALGDVTGDGVADAAVAWEESSRVTIYERPAHPRDRWILRASYTHSSVEDVALCDLDGNGWLDVASAGEDKRLRVARNLGGGTFAPPVVIQTAANVQQWTAVNCEKDWDGDGLVDLLAGGRLAVAPATTQVYLLRTSTPWVAGSWTKAAIGAAGWTMTIAVGDVDGDGLDDVLAPDRLQAAPLVNGLRVFSLATGAWVGRTIAPVVDGYTPRFVHLQRGGALAWAAVRESDQTSRLTLDGVRLPFPAGIGPVQGVRIGDVDGDGLRDVVATTGEVGGHVQPTTNPGVILLRGARGGGFEPQAYAISGPTGGKWDEADAVDVNGDGKLDVVTTEQRLGLGIVWLEQP